MANHYTFGIGQPHTEVEDALPPVMYDETTQSLVSADGNPVLQIGAVSLTASDAGSDWASCPPVIAFAATLDSGTATTVLLEVKSLTGVVTTAATITADTVGQTLRSSFVTREANQFRFRRSSGTGVVTIIV